MSGYCRLEKDTAVSESHPGNQGPWPTSKLDYEYGPRSTCSGASASHSQNCFATEYAGLAGLRVE